MIGAIVDELAATGHEVRREDLARISPMMDAHVIATGSYHFDRAVRARPGGADPRSTQSRRRVQKATLDAEA